MNSKSSLVIILLIIFSIGAGFGGYYLGRYLDIQKLNTKVMEQQLDYDVWKEFSDSKFPFTFQYPPEGWTVKVEDSVSSGGLNVSKVLLTSTDKNEISFSYIKEVPSDKSVEFVCDSATKKLNDNAGTSCYAVYDNSTGQPILSFFRFVLPDGEKEGSTTWTLALQDKGKFSYNNKLSANYTVVVEDKLSILDDILLTFEMK